MSNFCRPSEVLVLVPRITSQCCLVGSKNAPATLQHCFLGGGAGGRGSILSEPGFRGKYSKIKHTTCIFLNIFVQDCGVNPTKIYKKILKILLKFLELQII